MAVMAGDGADGNNNIVTEVDNASPLAVGVSEDMSPLYVTKTDLNVFLSAKTVLAPSEVDC